MDVSVGTADDTTLCSVEWTIPNFMSNEAKEVRSQTFVVGGYAWSLHCKPRSNTDPSSPWVSVFLCHPTAKTKAIPAFSVLCPDAAFDYAVINHQDAGRTLTKSTANRFNSEQRDWGFPEFIKRDQLTPESGFLTHEGALVLRLDLTVRNPKPLYSPHVGPRDAALADFLSLLDDPAVTSDLTVLAGGSSSSSGGGGVGGSGVGGVRGVSNSGDSDGGGGAPAEGSITRSFQVHRAILAARCPFFRTLFSAGMADSAARELPLPDADPDAFAALLRYMYGGEMPPCERAVHRAAIQLSDRLLMPAVSRALERRLVESADEVSVSEDLLWAAQAGREGLLGDLVDVYKRVAKNVDAGAVAALAAAHPRLVARLLVEVVQGPEAWAAGPCGTIRVER